MHQYCNSQRGLAATSFAGHPSGYSTAGGEKMDSAIPHQEGAAALPPPRGCAVPHPLPYWWSGSHHVHVTPRVSFTPAALAYQAESYLPRAFPGAIWSLVLINSSQ